MLWKNGSISMLPTFTTVTNLKYIMNVTTIKQLMIVAVLSSLNLHYLRTIEIIVNVSKELIRYTLYSFMHALQCNGEMLIRVIRQPISLHS